MSAYKVIVARLTDATGNAAYAGSRIYPLRLPQDFSLPAETYQIISADREHAMGGDPGDVHTRVQVDIYDSTYLGTVSGGTHVRNALSRYSSNTSTATGTSVAIDGYAGPRDGWHAIQSIERTQSVGVVATGSNGAIVESVLFTLRRQGSAAGLGNVTASLYNATGTHGTDAVPTGAAITSVAVSATTVVAATDNSSGGEVTFTFPRPVAILGGKTYCVALQATGDATDYVELAGDQSSPTHSGNQGTRNLATTSYTAVGANDLLFTLNGMNGIYDIMLDNEREFFPERLEGADRTVWRRSLDFILHHKE